MTQTLWLRAETKTGEERRALTPEDASTLIKSGFEVIVEQAKLSSFSHPSYLDVGCKSAEEGSWERAPSNALILGLKELPQSTSPLRHKHIYFAHAYKNQQGWQEILQRFVAGGGMLYDLEYLTDDKGRRVAAFGYWAGFIGMALALWAWCKQHSDEIPPLKNLSSFQNKSSLLADLKTYLQKAPALPRLIIIGAKGRCGSGAQDAAQGAGVPATCWDLKETQKGGPFKEVIEHDILINCVFVSSVVPPFINEELLSLPGRKLSVICDVSCDPTGDYNPLPIYTQLTHFAQPIHRLKQGQTPLDLIAIDHLPSLLPLESSREFSGQLLPYLLDFDPNKGVWKKARNIFYNKTKALP